ncbi:MAG: hypothetical protein ABI665_14940 [Vicinamibacterales bacterium]
MTDDKFEPPAEPPGPEPASEPETAERRSPLEELRAMPRPQKLILAGKADRATRMLLIRDVDPQVLLFVCKNPRITLDEILEITKLGTISGPVADHIAGTAQWLSSEQVRLNLVQNPKTPTPTALKLVSGLNPKNLQALAKSWSVKPQVKQAALKLVLERGK